MIFHRTRHYCNTPKNVFFYFYRLFAGARATRDQVSAAVGPSVQGYARTPSGSSADAQRGEAQDTAAPGAHQFGEYNDITPRRTYPPASGVIY